MAAVERFEDLIAWEKARELYAEVRRVCTACTDSMIFT